MGIGNVQPQGLSVVGPLGTLLHGLLPNLFLSPELVRGGVAVSMVAVPEANLLARATTALSADVVWLSVGLVIASRARARMRVLVVGLFIQSEIAINHLLSAQVGAVQLEASGVPFALMMVSPAAWRPTEELSRLPGALPTARRVAGPGRWHVPGRNRLRRGGWTGFPCVCAFPYQSPGAVVPHTRAVLPLRLLDCGCSGCRRCLHASGESDARRLKLAGGPSRPDQASHCRHIRPTVTGCSASRVRGRRTRGGLALSSRWAS